jgi:hypothetical protein
MRITGGTAIAAAALGATVALASSGIVNASTKDANTYHACVDKSGQLFRTPAKGCGGRTAASWYRGLNAKTQSTLIASISDTQQKVSKLEDQIAAATKADDGYANQYAAEQTKFDDATTVDGKVSELDEMSDTVSLRLQSAMDRLSKMMTMVSNILKKNDDTATNIVKNLK